jgi:hypothetical protein
MTYDPLEWTVRDPLEDTVPDPVERRPRLSDGRRRAIEAAALALLVPGLLVAQWIDDSHQARHFRAQGAPGPEKVTVVSRGGTGTLGRVRLRLLGRDTTGPPRDTTTPAGAVNLKLVVQVRPLDARHAKDDVDGLAYSVRDRGGHVWSAGGTYDRDRPPAAGAETQVTVTATVPERLASAVVLEVRPSELEQGQAQGKGPAPVLRFAH